MPIHRVLFASTLLLGLAVFACSTETPSNPEPATAAPVTHEEASSPAAVPEIPAAATLTADVDRSRFQFTGSKITGSHTGGFKVYEATAAWDGDTLTSGEVVIDITSLQTDAERLTGHMLSPDFFDAEAHPQATFRATSAAGAGGSLLLGGDLTLRGVTQPIEFPAQVAVTPDGVKLTATFEIDRQRWGVAYPGLPDDLIKDQVGIEFELLFPAASS
jgi:polyisoprenoid-binding protein YceI